MPGFALAGTCKPEGTAKSYDFNFEATFTSPEQNTHKQLMANAHTWSLGGNYPIICGCANPGRSPRDEILYTAKTSLVKGYTAMINGKERQFYKVNRNIQVASEVWIHGPAQKYEPAPFTSVSNENGWSVFSEKCLSNYQVHLNSGGGITSGSKGKLHLMIDKPFIGQSIIPRTKLLELFAGIEGTTPGGDAIANIWMTGTVTVPQSCELAPGQATTIDFGNLNSWQLAEPGETPQRTVSRTFQIQCKNISEMVAVNLTLEGNPHDVQTNALAVNDRSDLAIILKNNGRIVPPLREFATPKPENIIPLDFNQAEQKTQFDLEAYPIKAEKHLEPGEFKSQVTLKFEFE
ncbi:fimbrial protein [Pseudomonas sp. MAHUQ-55]